MALPVASLTNAQQAAALPVPAAAYTDLAAGRSVRLPPGTYRVPQANLLNFAAASQGITGAGVGKTRLLVECGGNSGYCIRAVSAYPTAGSPQGFGEYQANGTVTPSTTSLTFPGTMPPGLAIGSTVVLTLGIQATADPAEPERTLVVTVTGLSGSVVSFAPLGVTVTNYGSLAAVTAFLTAEGLTSQLPKVATWGAVSADGHFGRGWGQQHGVRLLPTPLTNCRVGGLDIVWPVDAATQNGAFGIFGRNAPGLRVSDVRFVDPMGYGVFWWSCPGGRAANLTAVGQGRGYNIQGFGLTQFQATYDHQVVNSVIDCNDCQLVNAEGDTGNVLFDGVTSRSDRSIGAPGNLQSLGVNGTLTGPFTFRNANLTGSVPVWNTTGGLTLSGIVLPSPNAGDPVPLGAHTFLDCPRLWGDTGGGAWRTESRVVPFSTIAGFGGVLQLPSGIYRSVRVRVVSNGIPVLQIDPQRGSTWAADGHGGYAPQAGAFFYVETVEADHANSLILVIYSIGQFPADTVAVVDMDWCPATP